MSDSPYSNETLTFLYYWQTMIAGFVAIIAAAIAFLGSKIQANAARDLAREATEGRTSSYAAMAALESQRLSKEAKDLLSDVDHDVKHEAAINVSTVHVLRRIEIREFLRIEWEPLALLGPNSAVAVYHLIAAIDEFNHAISKTEEIDAHWSKSALTDISAKADLAQSRLIVKLATN